MSEVYARGLSKQEYHRQYYLARKDGVKLSAIERHKADPRVRVARRNGVALETVSHPPSRCEVCGGVNKNGRALSLDHDHSTGAFRGWLCHGCNTALGLVKDNVETLVQLAAYLERNK